MKLKNLYRNQKIIISIFIFTLFVSIIPYIPKFHNSSTITESVKPPVPITSTSPSNPFLSKQFTIAFPASPSYSYKEQLLPKLSKKPIILHQYTVKEGELEYKVYTTTLPHKCFRWSKKIILNGTLELLAKNSLLPKKILHTTFKKSERYPILEYTLRQEAGKIQSFGRLILANTSIYLIEVSIPEINLTSDCYPKIEKFIQSFELSSND